MLNLILQYLYKHFNPNYYAYLILIVELWKTTAKHCCQSWGNIQILQIVSEFHATGKFYSLLTILNSTHRSASQRTASISMLSQASFFYTVKKVRNTNHRTVPFRIWVRGPLIVWNLLFIEINLHCSPLLLHYSIVAFNLMSTVLSHLQSRRECRGKCDRLERHSLRGAKRVLSFYHGRLARWIKWRACNVGEAKEGLENELWRRWSNGRFGEWAVT